MPVNTELVARLLQPLSGDAPAGQDLRYDARVDAIKEARREDLDLPGVINRKLADWPAVVSGTVALLEKDTKDLQLAAWLAEAMLNKDGYAGLATGLEVLRGYVDTFWETVYPLPEDDDIEPRLGPLMWVGDKLAIPTRLVPLRAGSVTFQQVSDARDVPGEDEANRDASKRNARAAALDAGKPNPEVIATAIDALDKVALRAILADVDAVMAALRGLEKITDERCGRDAPSFNGLITTVDEIKRFVAGQVAKRLELDPDPEVMEEAPAEGGATTTGVDDNAVLTPEPTSKADAAQRVGVVAKWMRAQDNTNPAPYLLVRGLRWGELRASAPELDPKLLEAPPTTLRARLKALLLDNKWTDLLEQSEVLMATAPGRGWLDLQRYVLTACAHLGGGHDAVAAAIRSELRALLAALPQLSRMTLMDDTPTANEETRAWLAAQGLESVPDADTPVSDGSAEGASDTAPSDGAGVLTEALQDDAAAAHQGGFTRTRAVRRVAPMRERDAFDVARGELSGGRPNRAIEVLMADLAREQSPRGRYIRQTQIAYVMVEAGLDEVVMPILQRLIETIDERGLEQWESGPLVAQPMSLMCRVLDRTEADPGTRAQLYLRICRLDPMQALALQKK